MLSETITEKRYPIQIIWVFKSIIFWLPLFIVFLTEMIVFKTYGDSKSALEYTVFVVIYGISGFFYFLSAILRRSTFHFSVDERFFTLRQGIVSREQRNLPYGVIQNVIVNQDLFDRIFGLASLSVENASQGAGALAAMQNGRRQFETAGFLRNKVSIPGLRRDDAEKLKNTILQKMRENPIEDNQSGL